MTSQESTRVFVQSFVS